MILYRYDDRLWAKKAKMAYYLREFEVISTTPKGYWIKEINREGGLKKKWIPNESKKPYADRTKSDAFLAYYKRKRQHVLHLQTNFHRIKRIKNDIEQILVDLCDPISDYQYRRYGSIEEAVEDNRVVIENFLSNFLEKEEMEL